jgi:cysteine synthase A
MSYKLSASMLDTIGRTPLVELSRLTKDLEGTIYAKIEYYSPGFSKKDRIALQIVKDAGNQGLLKKGQPVVELTSGNTGTGLALVCGLMGYRFVAVMSKGNSIERARMIRALGGEVVLVDQAKGSVPGQVTGDDLALVEQEAQRLTGQLGAFRADQFNNPSNVYAHELYTGEEIWEQSEGRVEAFADFAGTAGSFMGCAKALKKHNPDIGCYFVEPERAAYYAGGDISDPGHRVQGGGYCMDLPLLERDMVDGFITVSDEEAVDAARRLAREEAVFGGFSAGANVAAVLKLLKGRERGKRIAVLIPDSGFKYMSTDLYR